MGDVGWEGSFRVISIGKFRENDVVIKMKEVDASAEAMVAFEKEVATIDMFPANGPVCREREVGKEREGVVQLVPAGAREMGGASCRRRQRPHEKGRRIGGRPKKKGGNGRVTLG